MPCTREQCEHPLGLDTSSRTPADLMIFLGSMAFTMTPKSTHTEGQLSEAMNLSRAGTPPFTIPRSTRCGRWMTLERGTPIAAMD
jgi:hypothetical protein